MSEISDRYRNVAAQFTDRVKAVPDGAWSNPAPCEGWVARNVVRHLTDWLPGYFFGQWDVAARPVPSVDDEPLVCGRPSTARSRTPSTTLPWPTAGATPGWARRPLRSRWT